MSDSQAGHEDGERHGVLERAKLSRRGVTVLLSAILVLTFVLLGTFVRVPYVVLGPGPTFDTLGKVDGGRVVQVDGKKTYPTNGQLRMVTVSFNDEVTLFGALGMWVSGRYALAPREAYFGEGESEKEFREHSQQLFQRSESNAELAALHQLGYPTQVFVGGVVDGTPAAKGKFSKGDQIVAVNGSEVSSAREVQETLSGSKPGETVSVTLVDAAKSEGKSEGKSGEKSQDGSEHTTKVTLARNPQSERAKGYIGIKLDEKSDVPFDINIKLDEVGGPSAGMMFALAIIDRLTEGSLAGGESVAGTGTIEPSGKVGKIGGISFKLTAAREAGATAFLVPAGNCAEAAETAPDGLELVKVNTLDDAVGALEDLGAGRPTPSC